MWRHNRGVNGRSVRAQVCSYDRLRQCSRFDMRRLRIEALEDRRMLTAYLVDSLADTMLDDGLTTLREALEAANTNMALWDGDIPAGSSSETNGT